MSGTRKSQVRIEILGDGSGAQKAFKETEQGATQLEKAFGQLESQFVALGSKASGLNLGQLGGGLGQAGGLLSGLFGAVGAEGATGATVATAALGGLTAGVAALVPVAKSATDEVLQLGAETRTLARETGLTVEEASGLLAVFKRYGVDGAEASAELVRFARGLAGVTDASEAAATGGKTASAVMADLGITARDAGGNIRPMDDLLLEVADRFKAMPDGAQKTADAVALFGRSGATMIPILNQGSDGIRELMAVAKQYGLVLTGDNLAAIKRYGLAHKDLDEALSGLKIQLGTAVIPMLADFATKAAGDTQRLNEFVQAVLHARDSFADFGNLGKFVALQFERSMYDTVASIQTFWNVVDELPLHLLGLTDQEIQNARNANPLNKVLKDWGDQIARDSGGLQDRAKQAGADTAAAFGAGMTDGSADVDATMHGLGSAALSHYLEGMTSGGMQMFGEFKKLLEDGLKASSPTGKIDPGLERDLLPAIAQLADEIDRTGQISEATWQKVQLALGGEGPLVRELIADYEYLARAKGDAAHASQALANATATLKEDQAAAKGEAAAYADQIADGQQALAQHDRARAAAAGQLGAQMKGLQGDAQAAADKGNAALTQLQNGLRGVESEAQHAADAGNAALGVLQEGLAGAQRAATASAAAYQAENDQIQRQIDLNNQLVSGLEHERDVKTLAIDEQLAALRGSRNRDDLRHAAELRRERAQVERDYKPRIDLAREEATVANYGLTQQQKNIQDAAKADAARNAANIQAIQDQVTSQQKANQAVADGFKAREAAIDREIVAQQAANTVVAAGFKAREDALQQQIDLQAAANTAAHNAEQGALTLLQGRAATSATYWAQRATADQAAVDAAQKEADAYKQIQASAEAALAADQQRAALQGGLTPAYLLPTSGGTQGDDNGQNTAPRGGLGAGLVAGAQAAGQVVQYHAHTWNMYGVLEADMMERLTRTITSIGQS